MKNSFFVLLLIGQFAFTFAQNSLSGTITDAQNTPLSEVQVHIENLNLGSSTDMNGAYNIGNIPKGEHIVTFSYLGFITQKKIVLFSKSNPQEINLSMEESVFHMDEVIVSTPFFKTQSQNVMKVVKKNIRSLERTGAPTLSESLSVIPGVENFSTGSGIGKPVIRGLSGNRVLVYTQGIRLENQQWGNEHGLGINDAGIESVEVIKGPASLLYGSDALGGVLFINPEKYADANKSKVNFKQDLFSNTLGSSSSIGGSISKENFKFLARATYDTHLDYKIPNGDRVTNTRYNEKDFKTGIGYNSDFFVTDIRYNFNQSKIGITEGIDLQSTNRKPLVPYQELNSHILSMQNKFFLEQSKIELNLGYVSNQRKEFEEHEDHEEEDHDDHDDDDDDDDHDEHEEEAHDEEAALFLKLHTFTYEVKYYLPKNEKLESIIGIQGMAQSNENFGEEILIPNATKNDFGAFTTLLYSLSDKINFQGGIRYDYRTIDTEEHQVEHEDEIHIFEPINKKYHNFNASAGIKTDFTKKFSGRLNIASGFRAPNLSELTSNGVHHGTNRFEIGNPNLKSEKNIQTDIALEYHSKHIEFYVNGFYNHIQNYIYIKPTGEEEDDFPVYTYTQDDSNLYGGEFGFHLHPHPLDWLHLESSYQTVVGKLDNGTYLPLIPANKLSNILRGEFQLDGHLNELFIAVEMQNYFSQSNVGSFEEPSNSYNLFHMNIGGDFSFKKMRFYTNLSINNLFNTEYISHLSALKNMQIPNMGRNISLGLNFSI